MDLADSLRRADDIDVTMNRSDRIEEYLIMMQLHLQEDGQEEALKTRLNQFITTLIYQDILETNPNLEMHIGTKFSKEKRINRKH